MCGRFPLWPISLQYLGRLWILMSKHFWPGSLRISGRYDFQKHIKRERAVKMRILMVSNWLPPIRSGSAYYTSSLAESLIARGHEVRVVTLDWQESYETKDDFPFPVYKLPVIRLPKLSLFYNLK